MMRLGLWALCGVEAVLGVWTQFFPHSFYTTVPTVDLTPPFSEHLMRDFGGATLGIALVLGVAAWTLDRLVVRCALGAYLVFAVPHFVFHVTHLHHFSVAESVVLTAVLAASVVVAAGLLIVHVVETRRDSHDLRHPVLG
jgi:ethanolamine transporter EutH